MLRFTIRDMLWLTVVLAMAVGWWIDRRIQRLNCERAKTAMSVEIAALSAEVTRQEARGDDAWRILTETFNTREDLQR